MQFQADTAVPSVFPTGYILARSISGCLYALHAKAGPDKSGP